MGVTAERTWLLMIHAIPPQPNYLRVKIGRRLQRLGAVAIKSSVYALPKSDEAQEDFQWVAREIVAGEGEASVVEAHFVAGLTDHQIEGLFQRARESDYAAITQAAQRLRASFTNGDAIVGDLGRLRKRLAEVVTIDFFGASGREAAEALVSDLEGYMEPKTDAATKPIYPTTVGTGRTWVTRKGIKVDRIASAWLIRNFIDREAKLKFVSGQDYQPVSGELRFDMFDAEYTHEGDHCTFEVLLERFALDDPALRQVAEVVHDIDLKDGKFGRPETSGIDRLITGIAAAHVDDEARLAQGTPIFASLYAAFKSPTP